MTGGIFITGTDTGCIDPAIARGDENAAALECRLSTPRFTNIG